MNRDVKPDAESPEGPRSEPSSTGLRGICDAFLASCFSVASEHELLCLLKQAKEQLYGISRAMVEVRILTLGFCTRDICISVPLSHTQCISRAASPSIAHSPRSFTSDEASYHNVEPRGHSNACSKTICPYWLLSLLVCMTTKASKVILV